MRLLYQHAPGHPVTYVSLFLPKTGACLDPSRLQGLSRLMLRMLFTGAGGLSNEEINQRLERLGATMGASLANDLAVPRLMALTENLDAALELFLLSLREPNFTEAEFERLKAELLSSWFADREEHKPLRAQEVYLHQLYRDAPTGYLPDGNDEGLRASSLENVRAQYEGLFRGAPPILAVLSDLPEQEVRARIASRVEWLREGNGRAYPWDDFAPGEARGRRVTIIPETGTNTDEVVVGGFCASETDPDWHIHRLAGSPMGRAAGTRPPGAAARATGFPRFPCTPSPRWNIRPRRWRCWSRSMRSWWPRA
jgi:predicted Zn-dependent peptidase